MKIQFSVSKLRLRDNELEVKWEDNPVELLPGKNTIIPELQAGEPWSKVGFNLLLSELPEGFRIITEQDNETPKWQPLVGTMCKITVNPFYDENRLYIAVEKDDDSNFEAGTFPLIGIECYLMHTDLFGENILRVRVIPVEE